MAQEIYGSLIIYDLNALLLPPLSIFSLYPCCSRQAAWPLQSS
ncbi:hypothetical protein A670_01545 [Salmonella enterica subsp. enterica serovar Dublin str. UC16]|uniref:Uncharacterized protein n=1 Tax=Salmonella enterica subsp. enterica serovar Dublin str. UC16 TaxID=1192688 RepID=M7SEB9_SALDU|nr:hypothetical protein A670_01545 [Salmonella enterica subsp. enterica serovar Dublin str. UC16]